MRFKIGLGVAIVLLGAGLWYAFSRVKRDDFAR